MREHEGNLMTLTSDQIGEVGQLVDRLKKWQEGDVPKAIKNLSRYIQLIRFVEPQANTVLMRLSLETPETVRVVHLELQGLMGKASDVYILKGEHSDEAPGEDSNLMELARDFVLKLESILKDARHDTPMQIEIKHDLNDIEQDIIEALGDRTLTGQKLAEEAGQLLSIQHLSVMLFSILTCSAMSRRRWILQFRSKIS